MIKRQIACIVVFGMLNMIASSELVFGEKSCKTCIDIDEEFEKQEKKETQTAIIGLAAIFGGLALLGGILYLRSRQSNGSIQTSEASQRGFTILLPSFLPKGHDEPFTLSGEIVIFRW